MAVAAQMINPSPAPTAMATGMLALGFAFAMPRILTAAEAGREQSIGSRRSTRRRERRRNLLSQRALGQSRELQELNVVRHAEHGVYLTLAILDRSSADIKSASNLFCWHAVDE